MSCEFVKQTFKVFCGTYGCQNRAIWEVGNPEGPANLRLQLCEECARELAEEGVKKILDLPLYSEEDSAEPEAEGEVPEGFSCPHCGKAFENEKSCKMHTIRCSKREG